MKIYLDNCALGRLTDDQSQPRVREEAAAVKAVLALIHAGVHQWAVSRALVVEIEANPDKERRRRALDYLASATITQELSPAVISRAFTLRQHGFGNLDAMHLAAAIEAGCGALLTTDDRFISLARRTQALPRTLVLNPLDFLSL